MFPARLSRSVRFLTYAVQFLCVLLKVLGQNKRFMLFLLFLVFVPCSLIRSIQV